MLKNEMKSYMWVGGEVKNFQNHPYLVKLELEYK